jgi:YbgC/YbaW family acyl-CoA thioester hydrolase
VGFDAFKKPSSYLRFPIQFKPYPIQSPKSQPQAAALISKTQKSSNNHLILSNSPTILPTMSGNNSLTIQHRVEFCDTDAAGLMHFSTYFRYMESAEAELFRTLNIPLLWNDKENNACGFPRIDVNCRFKRPLYFEDIVNIAIHIESIDANRLSFRFDFSKPLAEGKSQTVARGSLITAFAKRTPDGGLASSDLPEAHFKALTKWQENR